MHFWWPPKVDDIFYYDWDTSGHTLMHVVDVLDPMRRIRHGYVLEATILEDDPGDGEIKLILGGTLIMRYFELVELGRITLVSRRTPRGHIFLTR